MAAQKPESSLAETRYRNIDGLDIRYARNDSARGRPILLLSPWPESIFAFLPTWKVFSALGPVVAADLPGFGRSQGRADVMSPEPMGEFILRIAGAFELERPHVVGPDVGTPALLYAAANHPQAFASMIIGGGATDASNVGGILKELVNAPSLEPYAKMTGEEFVRGATSDLKHYSLPDSALRDYLSSYEGARLFESIQFVRHYPQALPRLRPILSRVEVPCQIIVGRHDPFVPISNAIGLDKVLARSKLDILDCGHFVWEDAAAEYGRLAAEWIGGGYLTIQRERG
jgi:pimeloyl-ACP methyl ester carboxylesterase